MAGPVQVRRAYDRPAPGDGRRVLVDLLWPRGLAKEQAAVDEWLRSVAPSADLRRWYGHVQDRFEAFRHRYGEELRDPERAVALAHLHELAVTGPLTLLTATRDLRHSQAAVLAGLLAELLAKRPQRDGVPDDRPGDPACWQRRVCPACGSIADTDPPVECPSCHAEIPGA